MEPTLYKETPKQQELIHTMQKKIKAIILDLDLTLIDASPGIHLCIQHALRTMGYPEPDFQTSVKTIGLSLKDTFFTLTQNPSEEDALKFDRLFVEHTYKVLIQHTRLFDTVPAFVETATQQGYKLAIVTSKGRHGLDDILNKFNLHSFFSFHIAGDEVKEPKPHPMSIERALSALKIQHHEAVYVGDSLVDAKAAQGAKVPFVGVLTGHTQREAFADYPFHALAENLSHLLDIITPLK